MSNITGFLKTWIDPKSFVQLRKELSQSPTSRRLIPLDVSWYMPNVPRDPHTEFIEERIPGARFLNIDNIKDSKSPYPHMLPSRTDFYNGMSHLGLKKDDILVVYDKTGVFSSPRAVWMLRALGHEDTILLNSFVEYKALNFPLESGVPEYEKTEYVPASHPSHSTEVPPSGIPTLVTYEELTDIIENGIKDPSSLPYIIDARSEGRFSGKDPEPRAGLSSGHVPGAISIPFNELIEDGKFKDPAHIGQIFKAKGVHDDKPVILMCGTGVTACILKSGLRASGITHQPVRVYDGSWTEWAQRAENHLIVKDK